MYKLPQRQVHLDFHTSECIDGIGSMFDKAQFQRCLKKGHVNSITVFAKCHHGWAYFPSETNEIHPGLHGFDLTGAMLEACAEIGVAAPVYLSAGLDEKYFVEHPEHGRVGARTQRQPSIFEDNGHKYANDSPKFHGLCLNTPYLDVLVEQVKEVMERYHPIGIFLDIVGIPHFRCYCDWCRKTVISLGLDETDDASYIKAAEYTKKKYEDAINEAARSVDPNVRIYHNGGHLTIGEPDWARQNTHLELESLPTGGWGYDHFPKSVKYASQLGMEHLGMTGKFHLSWGEFGGFKHPNALRYEVALSLANGSKCSVGDQMHPYGFLDEATYELIGIAYAEAEAVEEYCYDIDPVADIAMLTVEGTYGDLKRNHPSDTGANRMLLEGKYLYDIIDAYCDFSKYKVIILPDMIGIEGTLGEKLAEYVKGGGKLLCSGTSGLKCGKLAFDFGVKFLGKSKYKPTYFHPEYRALGLTPSNYVFYNNMYETELTDPSASVLGYSRIPFFNREADHFCSHRHTPFVTENNAPGVVIGKDGAYIAWDIFSEYAEVGSYILKETVHRVLDELLGDKKTLKTSLGAQGVVTLNEQKAQNRHVLHALYATPVKRGSGVEIIEDLTTVLDTEFELKLPPIKSVTLVPENNEIPFTFEGGVCRFTIDKFTCKQVIVLEHEKGEK